MRRLTRSQFVRSFSEAARKLCQALPALSEPPAGRMLGVAGLLRWLSSYQWLRFWPFLVTVFPHVPARWEAKKAAFQAPTLFASHASQTLGPGLHQIASWSHHSLSSWHSSSSEVPNHLLSHEARLAPRAGSQPEQSLGLRN